MKGTTNFKTVIENHLNLIAADNPIFAATLKKPNKSIEECISYILQYVQDSGLNGFTDDEIYSKAIHYFDEDSIIVANKDLNVNVVVNHHVELTQEDIEAAKQQAIDELVVQKKQQFKTKPIAKKTEENQISLFH